MADRYGITRFRHCPCELLQHGISVISSMLSQSKGPTIASIYEAVSPSGFLTDHTGVRREPDRPLEKGRKVMPPFRGHFTNQQLSDVVNYVRSNFGNQYKDQVKPADVQSLR